MTFQRFSDVMPDMVSARVDDAAQAPAAGVVGDVLLRIERMEQARRPEGYSEARWFTLLKDMRAFAERWLETALASGWTMLDLFGSPADTQAHRWDLTGLVLMLDGREIAEISADRITVSNRLGPPNTFYRQSPGCSAPADRSGAVPVWVAALAERSLVR